MNKPAHLQKLRRLPEPTKKKVCAFIERCDKNGNSGRVLIETLRFLSKPPATCTLLDTRKQLRPKIHRLAYLSLHPIRRALSQESAKLLLGNAENEFGSRLAHTSRGKILGYLSLQVDYKEWRRLFSEIEKRRVSGPFSI
jgi:hypothetical protein